VASACKPSDGWRRSRVFFLLAGSAILLVVPALHRARPSLVWNLTKSAPLGLYGRRFDQDVRAGDWVIADLPPRIADFAIRRRYLGKGVPVLKQVAGIERDRVCATGSGIEINGRFRGARRTVDRRGHALPAWRQCRRLEHDQYFLMNKEATSFDSRYFGPIARSRIIAVVRPVWTWTGS
jgi:conjugative transfer signal peptidase TraF